MLTKYLSKISIIAILSIPKIGFSTVDKNLNDCATTESWVAQKVIQHAVEKNKQLDPYNATSTFITRYPLTKDKLPITLSGWGQLYTQTVEISIPFIDKQKSPMIFIATSVISEEECSLTEPSYIDITPENWVIPTSPIGDE
ncbi:exported hypothetical protein [Xenorhabdus vietnamensis]|uniref:Uncharacterized protein n=1 Tax=Xenorhabdus vietnamensis TaxID=351656 RepID=A0A1Y2SH06_9GAMM|nr:hypothetical protein [Xenorhabdus vietnamensis]OTA17640.1 exported hypothetical protein [Xenorhabdus vietnamensis]